MLHVTIMCLLYETGEYVIKSGLAFQTQVVRSPVRIQLLVAIPMCPNNGLQVARPLILARTLHVCCRRSRMRCVVRFNY